MWDNKYEAEKIEKQQLEYDKKSKSGLKRLIIISAIDLISVLAHIAVIGIQSPIVMLLITGLFLVSLAGFVKNNDIGFYAFCAAVFTSTALWVTDCHKLFFLVLAIFGNSSPGLDMFLSLVVLLFFMASYIVSIRFLLFDENVHCWKEFRRHR